MFGIGLPELALIVVIAILVFGPERIPELAKQAGSMVRAARKFANSARDELRDELGPDYADLELRDLDPRNIVRKHIIEAMEDGEEADATTTARRGRPLAKGELPPYDREAT